MAGIRNWLANVIYAKLSPTVEEIRQVWCELGESEEDQEVEIVEAMEGAELVLLRMMDRKLKIVLARRTNLLDLAEMHARQINELGKLLNIADIEPEDGLKIIQLEDCLRKRVEELDEIRCDRQARLQKLRVQEHTIAHQLGEKVSVIPNDDLSEDIMNSLKSRCDELEEEKIRRLSKLRATRDEIVPLMNELERTPDTPFEKDLICGVADVFQLTQVNINGVEALALKLKEDLKSNETEANRLRESLHLLWDVLQVEQHLRKNFVEQHVGHRPSTVEALRNEVGRCKHLKLQNASKYVEKIRSEICQLWDRCHFSAKQRRAFKPFYSAPGDLSEEILEAHDDELQRLKCVYADGEPVFSVFRKRVELWEKMLRFEKPADDPQRFNNRGGKLLREEKERKKLMILFPKLENELQKTVDEWETNHARRFLVYGKQVMDYVRDEWDGHRQEKENEKMERQRVKARKLEDELASGNRTNLSRKRYITTPGKDNPSKLAKVTPISPNIASIAVRPTASATSGRPSRILKQSTMRKTRVLPRRLLSQHSRAGPSTSHRTGPSPSATLIAPADSTVRVNNLLGSSHLSTYSDFTKNINRMWRNDNNIRSSAVTPQSPATPRRYMTRNRLGLPFLL